MELTPYNHNTATPATYGVTPGELYAYFYVLFMVYLQKAGNVGGSQVGFFPKNLDYNIPVVLAKFIQGYGRYYESGTNLSTFYNANTNYTLGHNFPDTLNVTPIPGPIFTNASANIGNRGISNMWTAELSGSSNTFKQYFMYPDAASGATLESFLTTNRMASISQYLREFRMISIMSLKDLPLSAPDGNAYAFPTQHVTNLSPSNNNCLKSLVRNFDSDVAMLYIANKSSPAYPSPVFCDPFIKCLSCQSIIGITDTYESFNNVFISCWYDRSYSNGRIINKLKYGKGILHSLVAQPVVIESTAITRLMNNVIRSISMSVSNASGFPVGDNGNYNQMNTTLLAMHLQLARMNRTKVTYRDCDVQNRVQMYYTDNVWSEMNLPMTVQTAMADLAPVVFNNKLYYPVYPTQPLVTIDATHSYPWNPWYFGPNGVWQGYFSGFDNTTGVFSWETSQAGNSQNLSNFQYDGALMPAIGNVPSIFGAWVPATGQYIITMNGLAHNLLANHMEIYSKYFTGSNSVKGLLHPHNPKVGAVASILVTHVAHTDQESSINNEEHIIADNSFMQNQADLYIRRPTRKIVQSQAMMNVNYAQLSRSINNALVLSSNDACIAKYMVKYPSGIDINDPQVAANAVTIAPDSAFSNAVVKRQAEFRSQLGDVGPISIEQGLISDCYWNDLAMEVFKSVSPFIVRGAGVAGNQLCGPGCAVGAAWMTNWLLDYAGSYGNDTPHPLKSRKPSALLAAVSNATMEISKAT